MSSSGTTTSNTQYLVTRKSYALNDKNVPIDQDKILITGVNGIIDYISSGTILSKWSTHSAISDVDMSGYSINNVSNVNTSSINAFGINVSTINVSTINVSTINVETINNNTSGFYRNNPVISSIFYGPGVEPSLNPLPYNFDTTAAVIGTAPSSINAGGGLGLGGRLIYGPGEPTVFARVSGVSANDFDGAFVIETLYRTGPTTVSLLERMRITNNGNVGIGTSNPVTTLDVAGDITCNTLYYSSLVQISPPPPLPTAYQLIDVSGAFNVEDYYNVYSVITNSYITSPYAPIIFNINGYSVAPTNGTFIHILNNSSQNLNMLINLGAFVLQDKKILSAIFHDGSWILHNSA
jgi:hypothetical protein